MSNREAYYLEHLSLLGIPEHMHGGMLRYLLHGLPPGSFLTAVLSNDLREAVAYADEKNQSSLARYVVFLHNHAPLGAWGSPERVSEWIESFRLRDVEAGA